jgi:hypothetical protein
VEGVFRDFFFWDVLCYTQVLEEEPEVLLGKPLSLFSEV